MGCDTPTSSVVTVAVSVAVGTAISTIIVILGLVALCKLFQLYTKSGKESFYGRCAYCKMVVGCIYVQYMHNVITNTLYHCFVFVIHMHVTYIATWLYLHTGRDGKAKPAVVQLNANPAYKVHSCQAHITAHGAVHQTVYNIEDNPL